MTGMAHRLVAAATAMMLTAGALAGRVSGKTSAAVIAGLAAGAILALLGMATFAWLDNAFFSVISQQQEKIDSFRESGMNSMHAYLNSKPEVDHPRRHRPPGRRGCPVRSPGRGPLGHRRRSLAPSAPLPPPLRPPGPIAATPAGMNRAPDGLYHVMTVRVA